MSDWIVTISTAAAAIAAVAGVWVAYWQLSNLNAGLRMNVLAIVLQLESELNARKQKVDELASRVRQECKKPKKNEDLVTILQDELKGYVENQLNCADRLAYCILRGYLPERDWKVEYRQYFASLVADYKGKFGNDSIYTNIIDLNNKWKRE